jgi:hypothetical protein
MKGSRRESRAADAQRDDGACTAILSDLGEKAALSRMPVLDTDQVPT